MCAGFRSAGARAIFPRGRLHGENRGWSAQNEIKTAAAMAPIAAASSSIWPIEHRRYRFQLASTSNGHTGEEGRRMVAATGAFAETANRNPQDWANHA